MLKKRVSSPLCIHKLKQQLSTSVAATFITQGANRPGWPPSTEDIEKATSYLAKTFDPRTSAEKLQQLPAEDRITTVRHACKPFTTPPITIAIAHLGVLPYVVDRTCAIKLVHQPKALEVLHHLGKLVSVQSVTSIWEAEVIRCAPLAAVP